MRGHLLTALAVIAVAASSASAQQRPGARDLTGLWGAEFAAALLGNVVDEKGNVSIPLDRFARKRSLTNLERDSGVAQRALRNRPLYKPQHWARVQHLDVNGNQEDPSFRCLPAGLPRMGPPAKIAQTPSETYFFYNGYESGNTYRVIYMDGREHPPEREWFSTWHGHSIGRWEGDTLVVDTVDFTDESWLAFPGYFHSTNMRVVERIRRDGDQLHYQATIHDPDVLLQPWERSPLVIPRNKDPKAEITEELPCSERDRERLVTRERG